jgi:hypothetical protein
MGRTGRSSKKDTVAVGSGVSVGVLVIVGDGMGVEVGVTGVLVGMGKGVSVGGW